MPYSYLTALSNIDFKQIGKGRNVLLRPDIKSSSPSYFCYICLNLYLVAQMWVFSWRFGLCLQRGLVTHGSTYSKDPRSGCFPCPVDFSIVLLPSRWWHIFVLLGLGQEAGGFGSSWQDTWTTKMQEGERVLLGSELMAASWNHGPLLWQWVREKGCKVANATHFP